MSDSESFILPDITALPTPGVNHEWIEKEQKPFHVFRGYMRELGFGDTRIHWTGSKSTYFTIAFYAEHCPFHERVHSGSKCYFNQYHQGNTLKNCETKAVESDFPRAFVGCYCSKPTANGMKANISVCWLPCAVEVLEVFESGARGVCTCAGASNCFHK